MSIADDSARTIFARRFALDPVIDALAGAAVLVVAEWAAVSLVARREFAGKWEYTDALVSIVPLAWLVASAGALAGAGLLALAQSSAPRARILLGLVGAAMGLTVGAGVTGGRHFAALPTRAVFVGALAAVSLALAYGASPSVARATTRAPGLCALGAAALAVLLSLVNHGVLPRLYPAFHLGLAILTAMTAPVIGHGLRARRAPRDAVWLAPVLVGFALLGAMGAAPRISRALSRADNLRMIFLDHAPLLGLGVELGALLSPPAPLEPSAVAQERRTDGRLQIDWRARDILLITVDALRADHVGAYGYPRPTTPEIDKLAAQGTLFLRAYCPTPHTSYSVASLMTGKNLHPLLSQGLGADSDTLAGLTRIYGYRTAAFYPPAVFFIDEDLFTSFRDRRLDFEYARVEFSDPGERAEAVRAYLATQPRDQRLFLWVHLFEPHEPYVAHAAHAFGDRDVDRYDGEVAFADAGIGRIVRAVRARQPDTVVIVTADHGEEFGEHRGRYHGTTVYEEQVRVPLVIAGAGAPAGRRVEAPVQTIDILPTVLGAFDIPRPPRVQGYDLGHWMRAASAPSEAAPAISETDDHILLADAMWRLVCARRAGACALYDLRSDPDEARDVSAANAERFQAMKTALRRIEATQGHYETDGATDAGDRPWPGPIRRGRAGDGEAAAEIAELLDDSDVRFRRQAAELLFDLKRREGAAPLRLAVARDDDPVVRRWAALALARLGEPSDAVVDLLKGSDREARRAAALALGENGDVRAGPVLVEWWQTENLPYPRAREVLAALGEIRPKEAVLPLIASLGDLRLRPYVAQTLASIGHPAARAPLAERLTMERNKDTRAALAAALVKLEARSELAAPLIRFLGTPDPLTDGLEMARRSGLLPLIGTAEEDLARLRRAGGTAVAIQFRILPPNDGRATEIRAAPGYRLLARAASTDGKPGRLAFTPCSTTGQALRAARYPDEPAEPAAHAAVNDDAGTALDFPGGIARELFLTLPSTLAPGTRHHCLTLERTDNLAVEGVAIVPLAADLPPPPPEPWESLPAPPPSSTPPQANAAASH
ncbi:MAG TPA: sulfatase-like hydrolase/transferase [Polyangiaceae bacterium]|nr:sulfatase-like hydrolase/transferase [Polyangiaceae bacterium]